MAFEFVKFFDLPSVEKNINDTYLELNSKDSALKNFILYDFLLQVTNGAKAAIDQLAGGLTLTYLAPTQIQYGDGDLYPLSPSTTITLDNLFLNSLLYAPTGVVVVPPGSDLAPADYEALVANLNAFVIYVSLLKGARSCKVRNASEICNILDVLVAWQLALGAADPVLEARRLMCRLNYIRFPAQGLVNKCDLFIDHQPNVVVSKGLLVSLNPKERDSEPTCWDGACSKKKYQLFDKNDYVAPGIYRLYSKKKCVHDSANWFAFDCADSFELNAAQGQHVKLDQCNCARRKD